jgi:hypothetical protein
MTKRLGSVIKNTGQGEKFIENLDVTTRSGEHMEPTCILGWSIEPSSTSWYKKIIYLSHKISVHGLNF